MKRLISIIMILSLILVFAACNKTPDVTTDTTGGQTTPIYIAKDPVIEGTTLKSGVGCADENGVYTIPEGITFICEGAFANDTLLKEIVIPEGVEKIGSGAFYACTSLEKVTMADSVKELGTSAFLGCISLSDVTLSNSLRELPSEVFSYCQTLEDIALPESLEIIGSNAFYGCTAIETFTLPASITSIGSGAFTGCLAATDFEGFENTKLTAVSDALFSNCTSLTEIKLPETVTSIGSGAFAVCENLSDIYIPNGVKEIGYMALSYTLWYKYLADDFCVVGDGVLIKSNYNPNLSEVAGTVDLSGLGIKSIGNSCFIDATALDMGASYGYAYPANVKNIVIPEGVETIGAYSFLGCRNISEVSLPSTLTTIGASAFAGAESISISFDNCDSLTYIGSEAFYGCKGMNDITLGENVAYIGYDAFASTGAYDKFIENAKNSGKENDFFVVGDGILVWAYVGKGAAKLVIPEGVKLIAGGACAGWDSGDATYIETYETTTNLSEAGKVKHRLTYAVTELVLPEGLEIIGESAFKRMIALEALNFPESLEQIEASAFYACGTVSSLSFGNNLKYIGDQAFSYSSAEKVILPESVQYVGSAAFAQCSSLVELRFPKNIILIGSEVVDYGCTALKTVYLPESFRSSFMTVIGTSNPDMMVYYYNE